jgi:adenylylsulfate kinase
MGLPGSGKTTLAQTLTIRLQAVGVSAEWFNADNVRFESDDWDFSEEGRVRQATRMRDLADSSQAQVVICDFVAPLQQQRDIFAAHCVIWLNTVSMSKYADTDKLFAPPAHSDFQIDHTQFSCITGKLVQHIFNRIGS